MKTSVKSFFATVGIVLMAAVSCTKDIAGTTDTKIEKHTCEMKFVGSLVNFDDPATKADASMTTWADGSVIYLRMASPLGATTGEAVYDATTDVWTISYYGSLFEGVSNVCSALYLEDKVAYDNSLFTMNQGTVIYEDLEGSYIYQEGDLIVTANLKPKTGRIRFAGTAGSVLKVYGITCYDTYDISTDRYTTTAVPFNLTVGEDGYTPYFYGIFTDTDEPNVKVWIDAKEAYTRFCSNEIFKAGQSGKMTIPTVESHNGWVDGLHFNVNGAQFKMVAVEGGTFNMGDPESTSTKYTAHKVTLTGFCIGETEVTNLLTNRVTNPSYSSVNGHKPLRGQANTTIPSKLTDLNTFTSAGFVLPTEAQWEFAAKGGVKSKGYKFSGSNELSDVAWHVGNSNSEVHNVKQLLPNELGLYDMSGNASEIVADYYADYPSSNQIDPCYTTATQNYVVRGGDFYGNSTTCSNIYRDYNTSNHTYTNAGFRLALRWNE